MDRWARTVMMTARQNPGEEISASTPLRFTIDDDFAGTQKEEDQKMVRGCPIVRLCIFVLFMVIGWLSRIVPPKSYVIP